MTKKEAIIWYESLPDDIRMKLQNEFGSDDTSNRESNFFKWLASFSKKKQKEFDRPLDFNEYITYLDPVIRKHPLT